MPACGANVQVFLKEADYALIMPTWSLGEIIRCHKHLYPALKWSRVQELFNKYGGVARNVLDRPSRDSEHHDFDELEAALSTCDVASVSGVA